MNIHEIFTVYVNHGNYFPSRDHVENTSHLLDKHNISSFAYPSDKKNRKILESIQNNGMKPVFDTLCTPIRIHVILINELKITLHQEIQVDHVGKRRTTLL